MIEYVIGVIFLVLGIPIGNLLAKYTKEELRQGQKWFKLIIVLCLLGAIITAVLKIDFLFFGFLFVAVVTSRSLKTRRQ